MHSIQRISIWIVAGILAFTVACKDDCDDDMLNHNGWTYNPTAYNLETPQFFPPIPLNSDNPITIEGVNLGRMLFFDPILSGDSTLACAGCHNQDVAFSDDTRFSVGIDGIAGDRNSMALMNLSYARSFFWDGRSATLEEQVLEPVPNPIEMHEEWPNAIIKLENNQHYPRMFFEAFGEDTITKELAAKSIAQYLKTLISANSRYDKELRGELVGTPDELTDSEIRGFELFMGEFNGPGTGADCFHCHGNILFQLVDEQLQFKNNGLTEAATINDFPDPGRGGITNDPQDYGKFKIPTLRNIELTAPYMHDGRFQTLEEVVEFYSTGIKKSPTIDPLMEAVNEGGVNLTAQQKTDLVNFLKMLTDEEFVNNPEYKDPFL